MPRPAREVARAPFEGSLELADKLPPGPLQDALRPLTGNRALLPLFSIRSDVRTWRLTNRQQKTVLRLALVDEEAAAGGRAERLGHRVVVRQVRGYKKAFREVCEWWARQGVKPEADSRFGEGLKALDLDPARTASLSRTPLAASMSAADAVRTVLHAQYRVARANEEGIRNDTDAEFLHDFRVAVRRARSFLGQLRDVFEPAPAAELRKSLSRLGRATNALRDLDVYLEHRKEYRALLSDPLAGDLGPLFDHGARARAAAQREVADVMRSAAYGEALERWRTCVEEAGLPPGRHGSEPLARVVGARVARKCRTVLEQGYAIPENADPDALHSLRIECKQLRYLTEILAELSPDVRGVVSRLKKLQDALGRIQDLTVHEARTGTLPASCPKGEPARRCRRSRCWCRACARKGTWSAPGCAGCSSGSAGACVRPSRRIRCCCPGCGRCSRPFGSRCAEDDRRPAPRLGVPSGCRRRKTLRGLCRESTGQDTMAALNRAKGTLPHR